MNIPYIQPPFNPYVLPHSDPFADVQVRLGVLERICFEILSKVSQSMVPTVSAYGPGPVSTVQVTSPSGDVAPTHGVVKSKESKNSSVRIVNPSEPRIKPKPESCFDDDGSTTSEESCSAAQHKCKKCGRNTTSKWDSCNKCYRKEVRLRNTVPCSSSGCESRVSNQNKSGLCHKCWTNEHPKCAFCDKRIRNSEESSSVCSSCHSTHKRWYRFSCPREAWQRSKQNGLIGKLYSRPQNGRFVPDIDQEEAVILWEEHIDYLSTVSEDAHKARNEASARRTAAAAKRAKSAETAMEKFTEGLAVEILPSRDEAEEDSSALMEYKSDSELLKAQPQSESLFAKNVTFVQATQAATGTLPGFAKIPAASQQCDVITNILDVTARFPVSNGKHHQSLGQLSPSLPLNAKPSQLLPPSEVFAITRESHAIPIVAPEETAVVISSKPVTILPSVSNIDAICVDKTCGNKEPHSVIACGYRPPSHTSLQALGLSIVEPPASRDKSKICVPGSLLPGFSAAQAVQVFGDNVDYRLKPSVLTPPADTLKVKELPMPVKRTSRDQLSLVHNEAVTLIGKSADLAAQYHLITEKFDGHSKDVTDWYSTYKWAIIGFNKDIKAQRMDDSKRSSCSSTSSTQPDV